MIPRFRCWDERVGLTEVVSIDFFRKKIKINHWEYGDSNFFPLDEVVLMQSTGLLNCETEEGKNVEGWEGDVADIGWSEQTGEFSSHRIILKSPFEYSADEARWLINADYIIIRGNIYENQELLEQANEN